MLIKNLFLAIPALILSLAFQSCDTKEKSTPLPTPALYDLNQPVVYPLPDDLNEISGLAYYPKDSSVFAIIDEEGTFFKIYLNGSKAIKTWKFGKGRDFEDVVLHDSVFYVLVSNGDIETLQFAGDSIVTNRSDLAGASKKVNEFETLYYDDSLGLVLICKDCEDDGKKVVTAWGFAPDSIAYNPSLYKIDATQIAQKAGQKKPEFKPSAAAINPLTKELYILASVNKLLVIADRGGTVKEVYPLDPKIFKQPEGITFTPGGDLLISNEYAESGNANILIFKPKKKG